MLQFALKLLRRTSNCDTAKFVNFAFNHDRYFSRVVLHLRNVVYLCITVCCYFITCFIMDKDDKSLNNNKMDSLKENCSKSKTKYRGKKRKRRDSGSSSEYEEMLSENALEMEKNLHASAVKNNLDEISVRKILKKVVTNDHVLALVKLREEELDSGPEENSLRPKLTRAKVKELMKVSPKAAAWNLENLELTPIKHIPVKTRPEVKALIAQELPEDEDDEEYEPTHEDVPSDDDQGLESCSDLDSQPRTPATPRSLHTASPKVVKDGPFKVPQDVSTPIRRKLELEEEATIALRTRSKLSLSATSIEHIESTFVPPDEAPMPAVDDLWNQFLSECLNPASSSKHEDDDDADPEYNVAADPDAHDEDEEALGNSIIKISKKELNDLVTELFNIMPEAGADDELAPDPPGAHEHSHAELSTRWEGKQEPVSDDEGKRKFSDRITFEKKGYSRLSTGKSEPSDTVQREPDAGRNKKSEKSKEVNRQPPVNEPSRAVDIAIEEREEGEPGARARRAPPPPLRRHLRQARAAHCVTIKLDTGMTILPEQIAILQQQLRQHIQLAASNYLQLYIHPVHWSMAPPYKEYLETLSKLGASNPHSVVKVCNLQPALELVRTWENTVSANTPENKEMVEFVQRESEKCRRRYSNKSLYVGEFHSTFQQVVANSPVFVYPHLLPPTPYRADAHRRYAYTRAEDALITLGLDQFWDYVENNPALYKPRPVSHPRHRWGLAVTLELVVKHMFPWIPFKVLLGHVQFVRKSNDKDNPIYKFFESRSVTPVRHKLLPYSPRLTLYEQPEHEVPKIWVRYLAKTSKRFRQYLLRRTHTTGIAPQGIEVNLGQQVVEPTKTPLPIDFTKEIVSNRINVRPKVPQPVLADKFDIQIANTPTTINSHRVTDLYRLVETSTAAYLMPLTNVTTTVNTNTTPISTPAEVTTQVPVNHVPECSNIPLGNAEHCSCCIMLRKICKERQTTITEYFGSNKPMKRCYCKDIKYPKITNRLRILVSNFKSNSNNALQSIDARLKRKAEAKNEEEDTSESDTFNMDDFVFAATFHLKLLTRVTVARDAQAKRRVYAALSRFAAHAHAHAHALEHEHSAAALARRLADACATELLDVYKDFLAFLTPDQADACDAFRDYFVARCLRDLVNRIETQVEDAKLRCKLLRKLRNVFYNNLLSACQICTDLLSSLDGHPDLARHVFSLFPHRKETRCEPPPPVPAAPHASPRASPALALGERAGAARDYEADHSSRCEPPVPAAPHASPRASPALALGERAGAARDYEADHSSSKQEDTSVSAQEYSQPDFIKNEITITENEIQTNHIIISDVRHDSTDSSNNSMTIDEDPVKSETAEWKRDEDKLILEVLKEHLTPEERKDKTILEMLDEKDIINLIAESLTYKSKAEVTNRVLYLLQLLVLSEK